VQSGTSSEYKIGVWQALKKIWREEGMKGMMAGNGTNCIRIVPYSAVQFGSYNIYKPLVSDQSELRRAPGVHGKMVEY
jgi:solute carrier family 25 (mitochondrial phosphate transporter), member 23/24/25/41